MSDGRSHVLRWSLLGLGVVALVAVGVVGGSYLLRDQPKPKTLRDAVGDFRRENGTTTSAAGPDRLPAPGVYEVGGSGGEDISFPPNSQTDGTTMPASVQHLSADCFRWRIDYNVAHWHQLDFCRDGTDLLLGAQVNSQRWDFGTTTVENTATFDCTPRQRYPLGSPVGTVTTATCTGTNTAVSGRSTITDRTEVVGREQLRIGDRTVTAVHLHQHDGLTGAQTGQNDVDWWFDAATGLPVKATRSYRLDTASPIGAITYTEDGQWQLRSLEPRS